MELFCTEIIKYTCPLDDTWAVFFHCSLADSLLKKETNNSVILVLQSLGQFSIVSPAVVSQVPSPHLSVEAGLPEQYFVYSVEPVVQVVPSHFNVLEHLLPEHESIVQALPSEQLLYKPLITPRESYQ